MPFPFTVHRSPFTLFGLTPFPFETIFLGET